LEICGEVVEDLVGGLAPHEGAGVGVPVFDPVVDVAAEFGDASTQSGRWSGSPG
jgi:hypothetical protein